MNIPSSARYDIAFPTFRPNLTGDASWQAHTTKRFLEDLDAHLDRLLKEYVVMIGVVAELAEEGRNDPELTKSEIADRISQAFPFAAVPDELFKGWRKLDETTLTALCRKHFHRLLDEHDHLSASLAITFNRIGDTEGWSHWRTRDIGGFLYGRLMWDWPHWPHNDETPAG